MHDERRTRWRRRTRIPTTFWIAAIAVVIGLLLLLYLFTFIGAPRPSPW